MSLFIPGIILQKVTVAVGAGVAGGIASSAYSTTFTQANRSKGNAVLVHRGTIGTDARLAIDGTAAVVTAGVNIDLFAEQYVFVLGTPNISVFSTVGGNLEVYLCYSPALGA